MIKILTKIGIPLLVGFLYFSLFPAKVNAQKTYVSSISFSGNTTTKNYIIFRELTFKQGDTIIVEQLTQKFEQSRLNLLNTSLFNFVTINHSFIDSLKQKVDVQITLQERWYIWPKPVLEITDRNFNSWWAYQDFSRINYGLGVGWQNFTGRMDLVSFMAQLGKSTEFSISYFNPFLDNRKKWGAGLSFLHNNNSEIGVKTENDKLVYMYTGEKLINSNVVEVQLSFQNNTFISNQLILGMYNSHFQDTVILVNPYFSYSGANSLTYFNLYYKLKFDFRDIRYYPLKGWYSDLEINKSGFGLSFEKPVNIAWIKTTSRVFLPISRHWYSGASIMAKISSRAYQPYFFLKGLGYGREFVRGYQYNVVDGQHFLVAKTTLKYALIPEKEIRMKRIDLPKFTHLHYAVYLTLFADAGYVWNSQSYDKNVLPETWLTSLGAGMDVVTYYDKVVRFEYTMNKSGKSGIFIHFISGI